MIDWNNISTVFLDMDGTLLDLHFDNRFWLEHLPEGYARQQGLSVEEAKTELYRHYREIEGTMNWYCIDYWSRVLNMDITKLKRELSHLITLRPNVIEFLDSVRGSGRRAVLVTNAHHKSLALKMEHSALDNHLDDIICAHDLCLPKEITRFWHRLQDVLPFRSEHTLLIDDNLSVLRAAREYGIAHLLAVAEPDSRQPPKSTGEFQAVSSFLDIMPGGPNVCPSV